MAITEPVSSLPTASEVGDFATSLLDGYGLRDDAPGMAILVARGGEILFEGARGLASAELGVPLTPAHRFALASVSKQIVAAGVLHLVGQGVVDLEDPLARFLPDFPNAQAITIVQLLNHTSGVASFTNIPAFWTTPPPLAITTGEMVAKIAVLTPDFPPGQGWSYNNSGYVLAAAVIEAVAGMPWHTYLETAILAPHGIEGITFTNGWRVVPGMVPGHSISDGGHVTRAFPAMFHIAHGAGGLVGDVRSLMKWNLALHRGDILPPAILARMITPEGSATLPGPDGTPPDYGLGVASSRNHGEPVISHGGSIQGFATLLAWVPSTQTTVAVLANTDDPAAMSDMIARQLVAFTIGKPYLPPMTVPTPPAAHAPLAGTYRLGDQSVALHVTDNGLQIDCTPVQAAIIQGRRTPAQWHPAPPADITVSIPVIPLGDDHFAFEASIARATFTRDAGGRGASFVFQAKGEGPGTTWQLVRDG